MSCPRSPALVTELDDEMPRLIELADVKPK
jgi:hypothetical protein